MKTSTASNTRLFTRSLAILSASLCSLTHGQFYNYWTGAGGGDWSTGSNWSAGSPNLGVVRAVENGVGNGPLISSDVGTVGFIWIASAGTGAPSPGELTIASGGSLTIAGGQGVSVGRFGHAGSVINQSGGSFTIPAGELEIGSESGDIAGGNGTYNLTGGSLFVGGEVEVGATGGTASFLNIQGGQATIATLHPAANGTVNISGGETTVTTLDNTTDGVGTVSLTGGSLRIVDSVNYSGAFSVGSTSTLNLGTGTSSFTGGLDVAGNATLGTGDNSVETATITGGLTLQSGATIDFSINGNLGVSDTWALTGGLNLTGSATYDLVVDAVAGSIELTDGDGLGDGLGGGGFWDIFSWSGGGGPTQAQFDNTTWNLSATENTRVVSLGTVEYFGNATSGRIYLTNFSAFAIPEPSTTMLLGMGGLVMYLRRRIRK